MSIQYYPNGVGGYPPGDFLDTCLPLQLSGNIWYVSSLIGIDAVAPAGQNREKPLKTVAQAVTNSASEDIIVFLPGHTETLTAVQTVSKNLTLMGEGVVNGKPSVSFYNDQPFSAIFSSAAGAALELRNIYFPEDKQSNSGWRIEVGGADFVMRGCYVECGAKDVGSGLFLSALRPRIENCTFISTAVATTAQPGSAINCGSGATLTGLTMKDVVVSAGVFGFSNYSAIDLKLAGASGLTQMRIEGLSLLLGADMALPATATGRVNVQLATGGSRVQWG